MRFNCTKLNDDRITFIFSDTLKAFAGVIDHATDGFCDYTFTNGFNCYAPFEWFGSCFMQFSSFDDVISIGGQTKDVLRSVGKPAWS